MDNTTYARFILSKATIRDVLETWIGNRNAGHATKAFQFHVSQDPLAVIRDALTKCPDESPAPSTSALTFISDVDLEAILEAHDPPRSTEPLSLRAGVSQTRLDTFHDQATLQFSYGAKDRKCHFADWRRRVDSFSQAREINPEGSKFIQRGQ